MRVSVIHTRNSKGETIMRRLLLSALLVASAATVVFGAHQATFVLRNGDRVSGEMTYKGGADYTLNGKDYSAGDVAVIEFAPGEPSAAELQQLPQNDNNPNELERHAFVTRDGNVHLGKLYKFSPDGETVTYDKREGGRQDISANDVARIYINPGSARSVFASILNAPGAPAAVATTGVAGGNGVAVQANQPWTDTGIDVKAGDQIAFVTSGQIKIAEGSGPEVTAGADGSGSFNAPRNNYPVPMMAVGGLIGRVGTSKAFPIGSNNQRIRMPASGRLYLGVNDDGFGDNSGAFNVTIVR
jgi:hypothetical protein